MDSSNKSAQFSEKYIFSKLIIDFLIPGFKNIILAYFQESTLVQEKTFSVWLVEIYKNIHKIVSVINVCRFVYRFT